MGYMRKDVNFFLLVLLAGMIVVYAAFSSFTEHQFSNLTADYQGKISELTTVSSVLLAEKAKLNQTTKQLAVKQEREATLSNQYDTLRGENDQLTEDKAKLQAALSSTQAELATEKQNLASVQADLADVKSDLNKANDRIDALDDKLSSVCDDLATAGGSNTYC